MSAQKLSTSACGYSKDVVRPILSKVDTIKAIDEKTNVHDIRLFVDLVGYSRDTCCKRAHTLAPLTKLCSAKVKLIMDWRITQLLYENEYIDVLLSYPNFVKEFIIHMGTSKT